MIKLAILIPVFNGLELTKKAIVGLKQMLAEVKYKADIIVIDDNSTDHTVKWLKEHHSDVYILHGDGLFWWSGGINRGMKYAQETLNSDFILWWNNDILPKEDYFKKLQFHFEDQTTITGSKIMCSKNGEELVWSMGGKFDAKKGKRFMEGFMQVDKPVLDEYLDADWLTGMGTLIPTALLDKIGFVDSKNFPQYHGDSDFTLRAKKLGVNIRVDQKLVIWNDILNSAALHNNSLKNLIKSLTSIKSKYNFKKDLIFYMRHAKSLRAYLPLFKEYIKYIGGFFKWKILGLFAIKKNG